jgi:hypothetical protein
MLGAERLLICRQHAIEERPCLCKFALLAKQPTRRCLELSPIEDGRAEHIFKDGQIVGRKAMSSPGGL